MMRGEQLAAAVPIAVFLRAVFPVAAVLMALVGCAGAQADPPIRAVASVPTVEAQSLIGDTKFRAQTPAQNPTQSPPPTPTLTVPATAPDDASAFQQTAPTSAAAPTTSSVAPAAPVPSLPVFRTARLAFTGDVLSHVPVTSRARANGSEDLRFDYRPMFDRVRDRIAGADLAICHLESPLSSSNEDLSGYPLFNAPGDLALALADAGYDGCSVASNHSLDQGIAGIASTLEALERHELGHAGMARTPVEAATPTIYSVNGIKVGHLSYTYGLNGLRLPTDRQWAVDVTSPEAIAAEARAAREAGAEFVVVSLQWGWEFTSIPSASQRELAAALLENPDIDLLVGSHAHVPQPIDRIGDKYVIYGLGNFLTNQSALSRDSYPAATADGVIVEVLLTETLSGRIVTALLTVVPTWVERPSFTIVDVADELAGELEPLRRSVLKRSWQRTVSVLRADGVNLQVKGEPS